MSLPSFRFCPAFRGPIRANASQAIHYSGLNPSSSTTPPPGSRSLRRSSGAPNVTEAVRINSDSAAACAAEAEGCSSISTPLLPNAPLISGGGRMIYEL